jgi:hypothetical protein
VILGVTLRSAPDQAERVARLPWYCVLCGEAGTADFILNVMLFAPLGVVACALRLPRWRAFACAVALTIAIETTQARLLVGRDGSLGDVLANSGGAVLGWLAYPCLMRLTHPSRSFARAGMSGILALTTIIWIATGIGLRPSFSTAAPWVGQLRHTWPGHDAFPGTILAAEINGVPIPNDPLDVPATLRASVEIRIALTRTGPPPMRSASLVRIVDARGAPQFSLVQSGVDLIAEIPLRASGWGFHTPEWEYRGAMAIPADKRWQVVTRWAGDQVTMATSDSSGANALTRSHARSIALGWVFLHPFVRIVATHTRIWNYVWLGWWFGLLGWLGGALNWRTVALGAGLQAATLLFASLLTGVPAHADEVIVALTICGLAAAVARARIAAVQRRAGLNSG